MPKQKRKNQEIAVLIKADNKISHHLPENGRKFSLTELQAFVGGNIEMVTLQKGLSLICNENGKLQNLPPNRLATTIYQCHRPGTEDYILGDAFILDKIFVE